MVNNFGANVEFHPVAKCMPRSEEELLQVLVRHRGQRIRAVGRLHSWSEAPVCPEVLIDLRHLDQVVIHADAPHAWAEVGAGCQIKELLRILNERGFTTPALGLIDEQSLAGAIATGTHGSGRHSLSHYVQSVTVAAYDAAGSPALRIVESGDDLKAARCSLGCLGIVTSVKIPIRPQYRVEEHFRRCDRLADVLTAEAMYPLQQFYLVPWRWDFFAQHRREVDQPSSGLAPLYRLYWSFGMDRLFHLIVVALARWLPGFCTKAFFRWIMPPLLPRNWKVVDRSDRQLTMNHELFRHIEIEIFVAESRLEPAIRFVRSLLEWYGGKTGTPERDDDLDLAKAVDSYQLDRQRGSYLHRYPICIRKVLPDDTLISMATGNESYYALSFISYAAPDRRSGFFAFAAVLSASMAKLFDARPHWGKVCPLDAVELERLYPLLDRFREVVYRFDPDGVFRNSWIDDVLFRSAPKPP